MGQLVRGAPGLYRQGLPSEPPLQLSAITGFVGIAERGPLHQPEPIRSWDEYLTVFGDLIDYGFLPHAVFGFFRNGGRKCFVVRVADLKDYSAENQKDRCPRVDLLRAATNGVPIGDANGQETIEIDAINEGRWGNRISFEIRDGSQQQMPLTTLQEAASAGTTTLAIAEPSDLVAGIGMTIQLAPPDDPLASRLATVVAVDAVASTVTLKDPLDIALPKGTAVLGRGFKLVVRCDGQTEVFDNLSMSPLHPGYIVGVVNGPDETMPYIERQGQGHSILIRVTHVFDSVTGSSRFRPTTVAPTTLAGGGDGFRYATATFLDGTNSDSISVVARAARDGGETLGSKGNAFRISAAPFATRTALAAAATADRLVVDNADGLMPQDPLRVTDPTNPAITETHAVVSVGTDNAVVLNAPLTNAYPLGATVTVEDRFSLAVFPGPALEPLEVHHNLSVDPASPRFFRPVLESRSQRVCGDPPAVALEPPIGEVTLTGGRDPGSIDSRWYTGYEGSGAYFLPAGAPINRRFGLAALESIDEADLIAIPDLAGQFLLRADGTQPQPGTADTNALYRDAHRQVLYHAAKLGDRLALLDPRAGLAPAEVAVIPQQLADPLSAKFGALYYPWVRISVSGAERLVPPSGCVAGVMARSDAEGGVGRAPANYPLKDVVDLEVLVDQAQQDDLNPAGVNCARKFEQPTIELWGARTLSADPQARYVNVRRLVIVLKKALARTLLWAVFEPNGPVLWRRIQASLQSLMQTLVTGGATATTTGDGSFFVKCDDQTNPPDVRDAGQVVANVGIALVAPAEFIVLNVKRTPESVSVSEDGG